MPSTRTQMKPTAEQKDMCHMVSVMGKGKPEKASSLVGRSKWAWTCDRGQRLVVRAQQQHAPILCTHGPLYYTGKPSPPPPLLLLMVVTPVPLLTTY